MDLPFVFIPAVYHIGDLIVVNQEIMRREGRKRWDFEFGLLSVSLDPSAWKNWAGSVAVTHEIKLLSKADLKMLDVDLALKSFAADIERCASRDNLLVRTDTGLQGTRWLYSLLSLEYLSLLPHSHRGPDDWILQTCLTVLAAKDSELHGIWFSDTLSKSMLTERGGIFQHMLPTIIADVAVLPTGVAAPAPLWKASNILN
jgi:hypothetical protein